MHDGGERSLLPSSSVLGDVASSAASGIQVGSTGSSENRIFVVATLAAIVLAGSAFAYRARPHAATSSKAHLVDSSLKENQSDASDSAHRVMAGGKGKDSESSEHPPKETSDPKDSKSSRSKDRRRRGKDPLKEVLKNPKKLKTLVNATPTFTPPSSAPSTLAMTSTPVTTPHTANTAAHNNSLQSNIHLDDETDDSIDPNSTFSSPFPEHSESSNPSSLQGSISRSKGNQVLQREFEQERESAWHHTLHTPASSPGMISAIPNADTSEVSQNDIPRRARPVRQPYHHDSSDNQQRISQSSPTPGPEHEEHQHQIHNHTYAVPAPSSAPSLSQKYASTTLPPPSSSTSKSVTTTDVSQRSTGQSSANTTARDPQLLDELKADVSQARALYLPRDDVRSLGLGLALDSSPPTPPDLCSALSSTSSSNESTELSNSTMTTNTSATSGAASSFSTSTKGSGTALQSSSNPDQSAPSLNPNHISADSSSSSSSSKTKHAPKPQHQPTSTASSSKTDPWEWDGMSDVGRKQSKADSKEGSKRASRKAGAASFSAVAAGATSKSPSLGAAKELEIIEEAPLSFPTLNSTPANTSRAKSALAEASGTSAQQQPSTPRRAPTPRRPQTPSYNSNNNSNCSTPPPPSSTSSSSSHHPNSNGSSGMPALSTQTQLASMRGALEASRLREEKNKAEIERVTKEMERLQWENANCKRGEMELRKQIAYLMHQAHSYAAMFAAVSPQFNLQLQQQLQMQHAQTPSISSQSSTGATDSGSIATTADSSSSTSTIDGAKPSSSSPPPTQSIPDSTQSQDTPTSSPSTTLSASTPVATSTGHASSSVSSPTVTSPVPHPLQLSLFPGLQMNGTPSASLTSPMSTGSIPHSPGQFFQYPFPQPHFGQHFTPHGMVHPQQHMLPFQHIGSPVQSSPHLPAFFNRASAPNGRGSVNASPSIPAFGDGAFGLHHFHPQVSAALPLNGPSSSGSMSPELNGSPSPSLNGISGKRQPRGLNNRLNGRAAWEETGDGWIGTNGTNRTHEDREVQESHEQQDDVESEGGFNELLADAILKRPGSIRVRSPKKGKSSEGEQDGISEAERMTEFAFPSLSDMGNVLYRSGTRNVSEEYPTPSSSSLSSPSADVALSSLSASPRKPTESLPSEPAEDVIDSSEVPELDKPVMSEEAPTALDLSDSDITPRKEQAEALIGSPPDPESTDIPMSEETLYDSDHRPSS